MDLLGGVRAKRVEIIVLGEAVEPERAAEVLRRTDLVFQYLSYLPLDAYGRRVRKRVGFPRQLERKPGHAFSAAEAAADRDIQAGVTQWREAWGSIDLAWLFNHQVLAGRGWCHADGTIALADELEDYPPGPEILEDCRRLAVAFPDLALDIALWGGDETPLGHPLTDAPLTPWPAPAVAAVRLPTVGLRIGAGEVEVLNGASPRLFERYGSDIGVAVETAVRETRRCGGTQITSVHGDAPAAGGVPDSVIEGWRSRARDLGLLP